MRRWLFTFCLACALAMPSLVLAAGPQTSPSSTSGEAQQEAPDNSIWWKWANTLIFAGLLGYLIAKNAPAFFNARSADIQKAIQDATGLKIQADFRSSEIDRKMATLGDEVKRLRVASGEAMKREHERLLDQGRIEAERMEHHVQAEVDAFTILGTRRIRQETARMAVELAAQRLRDQLSPDDRQALLSDFVHLVEQGKN